MPVKQFTSYDRTGRLRSWISFKCSGCGKIYSQRRDEYNRAGSYCRECKHKKASDKKKEKRNIELVCAASLGSRLNERYKGKKLFSTLTNKECLELFKGNCHYCGKEPSNTFHYKQAHFDYYFKYNGIDRIDNTKGYHPGNVVSCCYDCNKAKSDMTYDEFKRYIIQVYNNLINNFIIMPYSVKHKPIKSSDKDWAIINEETGKIVGRSTSKEKAKASVRARYASEN